MQLTCLGTGGYHPNERRQTACYYLPELDLVLDAGTGIFRLPTRLQSSHLKIVVTHAHLDHICGLTYLLVPMLLGQLTHIEIIAEHKTIDAIETHLFASPVFPMRPNFQMRPIVAGDEILLSHGAVMSTCPLPLHPGGSMGIKITTGNSTLAYITDTTTSDDYIPFIHKADLLLHECYFSDDNAQWCEPTGHSHTTSVANLAKTAQVKRLGLIHIDPQNPTDDPIGISTALTIFPKSVLAEDRHQFQL